MLYKVRKWTWINHGQFGETFWVHFRGHTPILGPLDGCKAKFRPFWSRFWPSLTPYANSVKSLWSQMACTGVPQIVLHILCSTRTYWGLFRPCKVSFSAIVERSSRIVNQYNSLQGLVEYLLLQKNLPAPSSPSLASSSIIIASVTVIKILVHRFFLDSTIWKYH